MVNYPTFFFKITKFQKLFSKLFRFFFSKINRISIEFFFKYKKIAKIILKFFVEFFFFKKICTNIFFYKFFFWWKFLVSNFSFHKNISAKIFFTIFSRISFVFDVCEILYSKFCLLRFFLFCNFGVRGKNFFFSDERECQI